MNIGKISPVLVGNFKVQKNQQNQKNATNTINQSMPLMNFNTAQALKAQVSFGKNLPVGITEGVVEKKTTIDAILNGENRIVDDFYYTSDSFVVKSNKNDNGRNISINTIEGKPVVQGFISDKLSDEVKIEFKAAKHKPELKVSLDDGTTIQLLEGSKIADKNGLFDFKYPGNYSVYENYEVVDKKVSLPSSEISFGSNYVSLLCKKDATVNATNNSKDVPYIVAGEDSEYVKEHEPTFVVLAGGFGTRFANMTGANENKPSFVMPNGYSILSSAYDLVKNATLSDGIDKVTYLEQIGDENPPATRANINPSDEIYPMNAYNSDAGAVFKAVLEGKIPNDRPLVILNADTITNIDISKICKKVDESSLIALAIPAYPVSETRAKSFGLMAAGSSEYMDGERILAKFVEKPKNPSVDAKDAKIEGMEINGEQAYYGNPGIYVFGKTVLKNLDKVLKVAQEIALQKAIDDAIKNNKPIPTELEDPYSSSTFLGNAFVPAVVKMCQEGQLRNSNNMAMSAFMVPMTTTTGEPAFWDDIGAAEAFVNVCQDIAYEVQDNGVGKGNKFFGIRGLRDFANSVDVSKGIVYASKNDKANFESKYADKFDIEGDVYITCKA